MYTYSNIARFDYFSIGEHFNGVSSGAFDFFVFADFVFASGKRISKRKTRGQTDRNRQSIVAGTNRVSVRVRRAWKQNTDRRGSGVRAPRRLVYENKISIHTRARDGHDDDKNVRRWWTSPSRRPSLAGPLWSSLSAVDNGSNANSPPSSNR